MVAMVLFPMYFLQVVRLRGIAVVAFAATGRHRGGARGDRVVSATGWTRLTSGGWSAGCLDVPSRCVKPVEQNFWYRSTKFVMRRAIPVGVAIVALLLLLGAPFLGLKWGFPDDRVLPHSLSARQVGDDLRDGFAVDSATNVTVGHPGHVGVHPGGARPLRRGAFQGARRVFGIGSRRHLRATVARRAAVGGHRTSETAAHS